MAIDNDATEQEKRTAETRQNATEQSRYFAGREIQRTVQDRQRWAEAVKSAAEKASQLAYTQSQQHSQTVDDRGKITPDPVQQASRHEQVADGITVSTVLAAHFANRGAQYIHQQREQRIQQAVNQANTSVLEKQNEIREEILKSDMKKKEAQNQQQAAFEHEKNNLAERLRQESRDLQQQNKVTQEALQNDLAKQAEHKQNQQATSFEQEKNTIADRLRQESRGYQQQSRQDVNNQIDLQQSQNVGEVQIVTQTHQSYESSNQQNELHQEANQSQSNDYEEQAEISLSHTEDIDHSQGVSH